MSNIIKLKRNSNQGIVPSVSSLEDGELAINTYDGKLFFKKTVSGTSSIITLQSFPTDGAAGQYLSLNNSGNLVWINKPETTTYIANSISMPDPTKGTYNSGTVSNIQTYGDYPLGNYYSVNDTATQPGFIVDIGFINVIQFNRIVMSLAYQVTSGHTVYVELYNYATSNWEIFYQYSGLTNWAQFTIGVIDSTNFISSGAVNLRVWHESTGNPVHETKFDYIALEDSTQGGMGPKGDKGATGATGPAGPSFKTITVSGQSSLVASTDDTLQLIAGSGIQISTHATSPKSLTITSTGSGSSSLPIKTFNILGNFTTLLGTARFIPIQTDTIQSIILTNGSAVSQDLILSLYRDDIFVSYFTLPSGQFTYKYNNLNIPITTNESYTVNVAAGSGNNFSMALYSINL